MAPKWIEFRTRAEPTDRTSPKPHVILLPQKLISQWVREFEKIAPGRFIIYKDFGDSRRHRPVASEKSIDGLLHRDHPILGNTESAAKTIVFSSYNTFAERHGPGKQKKWRINHGYSHSQADMEWNVLSTKWEHSLAGRCENVICDEAQHLKDAHTGVSIAVQWLNAHFHILASATPIPNGISYWLGYMTFIEPSNAGQMWSQESLDRLGLDELSNPFLLPKDHPGYALCSTRRAVTSSSLFSAVQAWNAQAGSSCFVVKGCLLCFECASTLVSSPPLVCQVRPR